MNNQLLLTLVVLLASAVPAIAEDQSAPKPASPSIAVELKLDHQEYLLGESIAIEYVMKNIGNKPARFIREGYYPDLRLSKEFRLFAFRFDEQGKPSEKPEANWPMPPNEGGLRDLFGPFLQPGESRSTTLFVTRYIRFFKPGKYQLQIENFVPHDKTVYSVGRTTVSLKQPTPEEARQVYEKMKRAPRKAYDNNAMQFLAGAADFETMYQPVYLPIL